MGKTIVYPAKILYCNWFQFSLDKQNLWRGLFAWEHIIGASCDQYYDDLGVT